MFPLSIISSLLPELLYLIMSSQQSKVCKGCHVLRNYEEFLNKKGVALKKCLRCRDKKLRLLVQKKNKLWYNQLFG